MADVKSAWNDAGDQLRALGSSLKQHYAQQREDDEVEAAAQEAAPPEAAPPEAAAPTGELPKEHDDRERVAEAFEKVSDALQHAFDALGAAAKDPVVKDEVKQTGRSVADALSATFTEISDDVRRAFDKRKGEAAASSTDTTAEPVEKPPTTPPARDES